METLASVFHNNPEILRSTVVFATLVKNTENPTDQLISFFSDWIRLLKAVAWYLKLKKTLMLKAKRVKELPTHHRTTCSNKQTVKIKHKNFRTYLGGQLLAVKDLAEAERSVIINVQRQAFLAKTATLKMTPFRVQRSNRICRLDPVLDEGIMRVGGRLHKSAMPEETKHPCILPKNSHVSVLLNHIHKHCGYSGRNQMLSELRKKYWILKGNIFCHYSVSVCTQ